MIANPGPAGGGGGGGGERGGGFVCCETAMVGLIQHQLCTLALALALGSLPTNADAATERGQV